MSSKKELLSTAIKRTREWIFSQQIPSDITVHVGEASFSLHKFPLVSKSGYIKKLVSESSETVIITVELPGIPGGAVAFELVGKFCYGINFEINTENIAMLRCAAEYLDMTENYAVGNLVGRTESYLNEVALKSFSGAVHVLNMSQNLVPTAENVKLVRRCIDSISFMVCKESKSCVSINVDWWAEDLSILRIDMFHRVVIAMMARGLKRYDLAPVLMIYAQKSLQGSEIFGKARTKNIDPKQEQERRTIVETVLSLLPRKKAAIPVSFLSMLLRAAIILETTVSCRLDLEKRIGIQLGEAALDDLLIPSYSLKANTLFDVDTMQRIMMNYLEYDMDDSENQLRHNADNEYVSAESVPAERVGKLMENYIAAVASDRNLPVSRFVQFAEVIPEQLRVAEDEMYKAIDIYLKAHPELSDMERKKICSLIDCQKLSREACAHAIQNERLPIQTLVQVLYHEQQRLRSNALDDNSGSESPAFPNMYSDHKPAVKKVQVTILRRENDDLKLELMKMKMRLKDIEKSAVSTPQRNNPLRRKSFAISMSRKLGWLYPFVRADHGVTPPNHKGQSKPAKHRRHSIS